MCNKKIILLSLIYFIPIISYGVGREQQTENIFSTQCGIIYINIINKVKRNENLDFFKEWKKYKEICSESCEYDAFMAGELHNIGKKDEANTILRKAIEEKGGRYDVRSAYLVLSTLLNIDKKFEEAKDVAMQAIIIYPYWSKGYYHYGQNLIYQEQFLEGEKYLLKSIELDPDGSEAYGILTVMHGFYNYDSKKAIKSYKIGLSKKKRLDLFDRENVIIAASISALEENDYKLSMWILNKTLELFPKKSKEIWYMKIKKEIYDTLNQKNINPETVFTEQEKRDLRTGKVDILDLVSRE